MKNIRINKKLLSMLTAITLMATPIAASTESMDENTNNNEFELVMQVQDEVPLTIERFTELVKEAYDYLLPKIGYDGMQADLQCLTYLVTRGYMPKEVEEELISKGIVFETDFAKNKYENFMRAYSLINVILDYNQSMVRKTDDVNELIDVSKICYGEADKSLVHDMHMNYFNAYKAGRFDNDYYQMVFKQLTTLNAYERAGNGHEISTGAEWLARNVVGGDVMQMLRDDMQEDFTRKELDVYFDKAELNKGQWILRNDKSLDLNCLESELEYEVFNFGELWTFVYDNVNNDIMETFQIDCSKSK